MYNIPSFNKNFMIREIICAEADIQTIDNISHQEETRAIINNKINKAINKCPNLLNESTRRYLKPINARAPELTGLPKIHKEDMPIRPVVNYMTAPGYRTAKRLVKIIKENIDIVNNYSIKNSYDLVEKIKTIKSAPHYRLASFDVTNLYTNVPVDETMTILRNSLINTNRLGRNEIDELMQLLKTILKQNYFSYDNEYFMQEDGLAMGSPLSGILADLYLSLIHI